MEKLQNLKWYFAIPVWYAITTTATFIIWFSLSRAMGGPEDVFTNPLTSLKLAGLMGVPFTALVLLTNSMSKKNYKFWMYAEKVESLIESAETKESLDSIFKNEFQFLRELSQGGPHHVELKKQHTIMQTKYKYVK